MRPSVMSKQDQGLLLSRASRFSGTEHFCNKTSFDPTNSCENWIQFFLRPNEVPLLVGWKLVLLQQMFCSRESTNCLMIQQNVESTQRINTSPGCLLYIRSSRIQMCIPSKPLDGKGAMHMVNWQQVYDLQKFQCDPWDPRYSFTHLPTQENSP